MNIYLLFFILITFLIPIADMLLLSVDNTIISEVMHRTTKSLETWDSQSGELPNESAFAALLADLKEAKKNRTHTSWTYYWNSNSIRTYCYCGWLEI